MSSAAAPVAALHSSSPKKRPFHAKGGQHPKNKKRKGNQTSTFTGTHEEVLLEEVRSLIQKLNVDGKPSPQLEASIAPAEQKLPELFSEVDLTVWSLSSTGDGLALSEDLKHVYVVPNTAPGDTVKAKVYKQIRNQGYSMTDLVKVVAPSDQRDDSLIKCKYFGKCSGCQLQMLPYDSQLAHKKRIVEKAYQNFSGLDPGLVPQVADTIGSPLQYGYRTKLTPHFDGPPGMKRSDGRKGIKRSFETVPPIGFMKKNTSITIDIEDCPIGTAAVRLGMKNERKRVADELDNYHKGATLLLRENTRRIPLSHSPSSEEAKQGWEKGGIIPETRGDMVYLKSCITDSKATTTEYIDDFVFLNPAGAFFQNNNSILPTFTQYIRDHILPPEPASRARIKNLVDAYSGSGLFTITLSSMFKKSLGIDISASSIDFAKSNAKRNKLPESQADFMAADAANIFAKITFPGEETVVVVDPPRKGCDNSFLRQLLTFGPARVIYVSCNVHTQARDVGVLVGGMKDVDGGFGEGNGAYNIESLVGFDFFPQTGHVEGVAVLSRKEKTP